MRVSPLSSHDPLRISGGPDDYTRSMNCSWGIAAPSDEFRIRTVFTSSALPNSKRPLKTNRFAIGSGAFRDCYVLRLCPIR
jgi:hypothetical protein